MPDQARALNREPFEHWSNTLTTELSVSPVAEECMIGVVMQSINRIASYIHKFNKTTSIPQLRYQQLNPTQQPTSSEDGILT